MIIGDNDYPFPIPLERNKNGTWSFDTDEGRREILYRRIGHNELDTIQTALAYVDAQKDYAENDRGGGVGVYAQRFISTAGKKDGLYWPTAQGEEESPLGELFAAASRQGYHAGEGRSPYHGYYYKILTKQGPAAEGGAADYVVNGKMIGGFGLVAYPAEYRNSGVMTFIVNYVGQVLSKGSRAGHRRHCREDGLVQSGPDLEEGRYQRVGAMRCSALVQLFRNTTETPKLK